jgi:anhydro-N-acetylmuramic acid kinase
MVANSVFLPVMETYKVIGVMSGTSMDGLDLAYCEFEHNEGNWKYTIGAAETIPYNPTWITRLTELHKQPAFVLTKTDLYYGRYIGHCIKTFVTKHQVSVDFIASHGHTIFHNPAEGYTTQIGNGNAIHAESGIPVIYDFRTLDVTLGGQGAPLVPIGDRLLFHEYEACLNLGGFANISYEADGKRRAFDICPCNIILNHVAQQAGYDYDENGEMAASGIANEQLLGALNDLPFYKRTGAKSLGREWVEQEIWPLVQQYEITIEDLLATFTQHISDQIATVFQTIGAKKVLFTGGGTYNALLINQLQTKGNSTVEIPDPKLINFKEALIFAFLGVLRERNEVNALKEVTGARRDSSGGVKTGF